ncbi:hypothetical protein GCM10020255_055360 [Rhodococcus baikonurensis]
MPETGLQGDVPAEDRNSGRSRDGYSCNMSQIGGYSGRGGGITSTNFEHCSYVGSFFPGTSSAPRKASKFSTCQILPTPHSPPL